VSRGVSSAGAFTSAREDGNSNGNRPGAAAPVRTFQNFDSSATPNCSKPETTALTNRPVFPGQLLNAPRHSDQPKAGHLAERNGIDTWFSASLGDTPMGQDNALEAERNWPKEWNRPNKKSCRGLTGFCYC
jgi:hypothetical protein